MTSATLERARQFIGSIVRKKQEVKKDLWKSYDDLVERLVDGQEIDGDEFETILEACGKTEKDLLGDPNFQGKGWIVEFNGDVERKQKRRGWARDLQELNDLQTSKVPHLEKTLAAAQEKLQKVLEPLQRAVTEAHQRLQEANSRTLQLVSAEQYLSQTVANPAILERENEIENRQKELRQLEAHWQNTNSQLVLNYEFEKKQLEELRSRPKPESSAVVTSQHFAEIRKLEESIESRRPLVEIAQRELQAIKREFEQLTAERKVLYRQKLIP